MSVLFNGKLEKGRTQARVTKKHKVSLSLHVYKLSVVVVVSWRVLKGRFWRLFELFNFKFLGREVFFWVYCSILNSKRCAVSFRYVQCKNTSLNLLPYPMNRTVKLSGSGNQSTFSSMRHRYLLVIGAFWSHGYSASVARNF